MTIRAALLEGAELLAGAAVEAPRLNAEVLLAHALRRDRLYLLTHPNEALSDMADLRYSAHLLKRMQGAPTQHLTGVQEFYGRPFAVSRDVLIPRPETEHLVEAVLALPIPYGPLVDVGCGSGAIAITISLELNRPVIALDLSTAALAIASRNANHLRGPVQFLQADLTTALAPRSVAVIVSNPPYISEAEEPGLQREVRDFEPRLALIAGPEGTEVYERLITEAERVLRPDGWLALELGHQSSDFVKSRLSTGWQKVEFIKDYSGITRVCQAQWQG